MKKKLTVDYRKLHEYLYNNCDRTHKLLITTDDVKQHFGMTESAFRYQWRMLNRAGLVNTRKKDNTEWKGRNYEYYIMPFDNNNLNRINEHDVIDILREVDRSVQKMIDYFFTEKNDFITVDEIDKKYTGLDEISADLLYWDLCSLKEYLDDFDSLVTYRKIKESADDV